MQGKKPCTSPSYYDIRTNMTIDNIECTEKKVFFRIYTETLDLIYSELLDPEASLSEEISQITTLEGMASIEGDSY